MHKNVSMIRKIRLILREPLSNQLYRVEVLRARLKAFLYYRWIFGSFGAGSYLHKPLLLLNTQHIHIGRNSTFRQGLRMETVRTNPLRTPELRIGDNTSFEQNVHIICHNRVTIGSNVTVAPHCSIMDTSHSFEQADEHTKIGNLVDDDDATVEIGDGCWIGIGATILRNVKIGKRSVIGAHSVVRSDIPDGCIAAGVPAKIIRRYLPNSI
jgi:acetyltransferase-like isoleucine patch superfamily enzyme